MHAHERSTYISLTNPAGMENGALHLRPTPRLDSSILISILLIRGGAQQHRTTARPFFAHDRIRDFEIFEKYTARTMSILITNAASNTPCEAQDLYARFTLDAASEFLFGKNLDTLSLPFPIPGKAEMGAKGSAMEGSWGAFAEAFETCQQNVTKRARLGKNWPLFELFRDNNQKHVEVIHDWLDPLVKKAIDDRLGTEKAGVSVPLSEKTFLQHLADSTDGKSLAPFSASVKVSHRPLRSCHDSRPAAKHAFGFEGHGKL